MVNRPPLLLDAGLDVARQAVRDLDRMELSLGALLSHLAVCRAAVARAAPSLPLLTAEEARCSLAYSREQLEFARLVIDDTLRTLQVIGEKE
jgi:hypothetical protein